MREIKFRAWGHQKNDKYRMFYGVSLSSWTIPYWQDMAICDHKLMQYINRKDENGKEIFEGDIVRGRYIDDLNGVTFLSEEITELDPESPCRGYWEDCEIIGNIYENPELLKD